MIKVVLFVLLIYCIFAWGYGLSLMIDVFNEIKEEKLKYIAERKPIWKLELMILEKSLMSLKIYLNIN